MQKARINRRKSEIINKSELISIRDNKLKKKEEVINSEREIRRHTFSCAM